MSRPRLAILGATGSIGQNTVDVVRRSPERWLVHAVTANSDTEGLVAVAGEVNAGLAVIADATLEPDLRRGLDEAGLTQVVAGSGPDAVAEVAASGEVDTVVAGIVGAAGLRPVMAAAESGKTVLLANKEALVMAGAVVMEAVRRGGATLVPLDSEHNALFQCLPSGYCAGRALPTGVEGLTLTGSGGPFRDRPLATFPAITPDEACRHPTWSMGRKISVDSATLMNKGLELIEACWLFDVAPRDVDVVIHPQSVVHSLVAYRDGSVLAQLAHPDMRAPIAHALAWPERVESGAQRLDLITLGRLDFEAPDTERFPCLRLAADALRAGPGGPAVLNAANEVAVGAFLEGRLGFDGIPGVIADALEAACDLSGPLDLDRIMALDAAGRRAATAALNRAGGSGC